MEDSSRFRVDVTAAGSEPQSGHGDRGTALARGQARNSQRSPGGQATSPAFVGNAMKALFETADVSIRRGDETKVITRSDAPEGAASGAKASVSASDDELAAALKRGSPAELAVWLVVAAALFAVAGYALLN